MAENTEILNTTGNMKSDDLITTELVENALRHDQGTGAKVISWSPEDGAKAMDNFFNIVKRINVCYSKEGQNREIAYIVKLNPCNGENDIFNPYRQRAMQKEVFFYRELLPLLNEVLKSVGEKPLKVPKFLCATTEIGREVVFLEDLKPRGFETCDTSKPMDDAHTTLMVTEIGRFHAAARLLQDKYDKDLGEVFPLLIESWQCDDPKLSDAFCQVFQKGIKLSYNLAKAMGGYEDLLPWLKKVDGMETILEDMACKGLWRTAIHADVHRTNVMYRYDQSRNVDDIMVIDWQTIRMTNMAAELNYMLYSAFLTNRKEMHSFILDTYCKSFQKVNSKGMFFTKEELANEIEKKNTGFFVCFFLIPLSLCVTKQDELFKVDDSETDEEAEAAAKVYLKRAPTLKFMITELLDEVRRKKLHLK